MSSLTNIQISFSTKEKLINLLDFGKFDARPLGANKGATKNIFKYLLWKLTKYQNNLPEGVRVIIFMGLCRMLGVVTLTVK